MIPSRPQMHDDDDVDDRPWWEKDRDRQIARSGAARCTCRSLPDTGDAEWDLTCPVHGAFTS